MDSQVTSIEVIQKKAADAFKNDLPTSACPYARGSREHTIWVNHYAALSNRMWQVAA